MKRRALIISYSLLFRIFFFISLNEGTLLVLYIITLYNR